MKLSKVKQLIKESIKDLNKNLPSLNEQQTNWMACCDTTAINYNSACPNNPSCTCQNASCVSVTQICTAVVSPSFANSMASLGCGGLQQRRTRLDNKLGVVSTPGSTLPGAGNWDSYDFEADSIGAGVQGAGHSSWQQQLSNKIACIDMYLNQQNC